MGSVKSGFGFLVNVGLQIHSDVRKANIGEHGGPLVIITSPDRIVFVVVTASTAYRQAKHGGAHGVDHVI